MATPGKKTTRPKKLTKTKFVFWCHTDLPEDYIFIYSTSELGAQRKYRLEVNYIDFQHIIVKKICNIPAALLKEMKIKKDCDIASDELLKRVGIEFLTKDEKVFRYKGKIHKESSPYERILREEGNQTPSVYLFKVKDRDGYKIGNSVNIPRRLKETTGPDHLDFLTYVQTPLAAKLEKNILKQFQKFSLGKEFVGLDSWGYELLEATFNLYHLEYSKSDITHTPSDYFKTTLIALTELVERHNNNMPPSVEDKLTGDKLIKDIYNLSKEKAYKAIADWRSSLMALYMSSTVE